jgi:hypothetical protein
VFGRCDRDPGSLVWRTWGCKRCGWEKRLDDRHVADRVAHAVATGNDSLTLG